jgi:hypothetical protein
MVFWLNSSRSTMVSNNSMQLTALRAAADAERWAEDE